MGNSIIEHVDWEALDDDVRIQQFNRETHSPVISLFRWWARRPHAVAGAVLDAAKKQFGSESFLVADPFSGGGTVAFESVRRGLATYAQDLYRWPSFGLATCLRPTDLKEFEQAASTLLKKLTKHRRKFWRREGTTRFEITHVLRVRKVVCSSCHEASYQFRDPFISLASRSAHEKQGYFGCQSCGTVSRRAFGVTRFACDGCGDRIPTSLELRTVNDDWGCVHCGFKTGTEVALQPPLLWHPILVQERNLNDDRQPPILRPLLSDDPIGKHRDTDILCTPIKDGLETRHLLRSGFQKWGDIYSARQLSVFVDAVSTIRSLEVSTAVRDRLLLAVLGSGEMPAYLTRWERFHPKAIEATANHRFARATVVAECNLLSPVGRGTIPRRLGAVSKALKWLTSNSSLSVRHLTTRSKQRRSAPQGVLVVTGSSDHQLLPDKSASLVLTDPPYHDDLQYGELARLFHAWMKEAVGGCLPNEDEEAVPNGKRGTGDQHYTDKVTSCLKESRRTLCKDGRLVLTFHNRNMAAWKALAKALRRARFLIVALATVQAENSADHSKRGKKTFLCDLVIECVPAPRQRSGRTRVFCKGSSASSERQELMAIGRAMASYVNARVARSLDSLTADYRGTFASRDGLIQ